MGLWIGQEKECDSSHRRQMSEIDQLPRLASQSISVNMHDEFAIYARV